MNLQEHFTHNGNAQYPMFPTIPNNYKNGQQDLNLDENLFSIQRGSNSREPEE
jgi:hypothetical protein